MKLNKCFGEFLNPYFSKTYFSKKRNTSTFTRYKNFMREINDLQSTINDMKKTIDGLELLRNCFECKSKERTDLDPIKNFIKDYNNTVQCNIINEFKYVKYIGFGAITISIILIIVQLLSMIA